MRNSHRTSDGRGREAMFYLSTDTDVPSLWPQRTHTAGCCPSCLYLWEDGGTGRALQTCTGLDMGMLSSRPRRFCTPQVRHLTVVTLVPFHTHTHRFSRTGRVCE